MRNNLRTLGYVPIVFDFEQPKALDLWETVTALAHLSRFIIADLTRPRTIPKELEKFVPDLAVPVQPLLQGAECPYAGFKDYWKYQWVLKENRYEEIEDLLVSLRDKLIPRVERTVQILEEKRKLAMMQTD
jgi:hypothetical protein